MIGIDSNFKFKFPTAENTVDLIGKAAGINWWGRHQAAAGGHPL
jgi:hypothetical protein